jgi:hypothetical protein
MRTLEREPGGTLNPVTDSSNVFRQYRNNVYICIYKVILGT